MAKRRKPEKPPLRLVTGEESGAKKPKATRKKSAKAADAPPPPPPAPLDPKRAVAPPELPKEEAAYFREIVQRLAERGIESAPHRRIIELAAQRKSEVDQLTATIAKHGHTYERPLFDDAGNEIGMLIKPNPAVRMRSEAMRHLHALLAELKLTPKAIGAGGKGGANGSSSAADDWGEDADLLA